jgi:hypothetical protein
VPHGSVEGRPSIAATGTAFRAFPTNRSLPTILLDDFRADEAQSFSNRYCRVLRSKSFTVWSFPASAWS